VFLIKVPVLWEPGEMGCPGLARLRFFEAGELEDLIPLPFGVEYLLLEGVDFPVGDFEQGEADAVPFLAMFLGDDLGGFSHMFYEQPFGFDEIMPLEKDFQPEGALVTERDLGREDPRFSLVVVLHLWIFRRIGGGVK